VIASGLGGLLAGMLLRPTVVGQITISSVRRRRMHSPKELP
jgi:hypothetical protein